MPEVLIEGCVGLIAPTATIARLLEVPAVAVIGAADVAVVAIEHLVNVGLE